MTNDENTSSGTILDDAAVQEFAANFRGQLIRSRDDGYDAARAVYNGMVDRRPALIARCAGVADVIAAVNFARENGLPVARSGVAGTPSPATPFAKGASSSTSSR